MKKKSLIAILEGTVEEGCSAEEIAEIRANSIEIGAALATLGYHTEVVTLGFDVQKARRELSALKPEAVFNLVDSIEGIGTLAVMAPLLLEHMGLPFTGAGSTATQATSHKLIAKQMLRGAGLPTPDWRTEADIAARRPIRGPYLLKSVTEHASFGIYADSIVKDSKTLHARWKERQQDYWGEWFAEAFIDGREFNISVLGDGRETRVLPHAEITFTKDFPKDAPRIIDYQAKWQQATPQYKGTVRSFEFKAADKKLLSALEKTALACWQLFGLGGYARVDFRVDKAGKIYVLEVNSNPFLTAGEGFGAAGKRAGIAFPALVQRIVDDALRRARQSRQLKSSAA